MAAAALRAELLRRHGPGAPGWLSGHAADASPAKAARPAVVPLGFVGRPHADGHLLGLAVALPAGFDPAVAAVLFDLLERHGEPPEVAAGVGFARLTVSHPALERTVGGLDLELDERPADRRPVTLRPDTWARPAHAWATATPLVLPRFPRRRLTAEDVVAAACREAGYPHPTAVRVSHAPLAAGVPHARSFFARRPAAGRPPRPPRAYPGRFTLRFEGAAGGIH